MLIWLALAVLLCTARSAFSRAMFTTALFTLALYAFLSVPAHGPELDLIDTTEPAATTTGGFHYV